MKPTLRRCIRNDLDLQKLWEKMMGKGGFGLRTLWVIFLDEEGYNLPLVMPIDDLPLLPDDTVDNLMMTLKQTMTESAAASAAFLVSRPGPRRKRPDDIAWAAALRTGAAQHHIRTWPIHLATRHGVEPFSPDDLISVSA